MGWTWDDLRVTPAKVVALAMDRLIEHRQAEERANSSSRRR